MAENPWKSWFLAHLYDFTRNQHIPVLQLNYTTEEPNSLEAATEPLTVVAWAPGKKHGAEQGQKHGRPWMAMDGHGKKIETMFETIHVNTFL